MRISSASLLISLPLSTLGFAVRPASFARLVSVSKKTTTVLQYSDDVPSDVSDSEEKDDFLEAIPLIELDPEAIRLKEEVMDLADSTKRGFSASSVDRQRMKSLVHELIQYMPTTEPASPYYESAVDATGPTLAGKWTLVYTDAPDITTLDFGGPLASAKLGRIGQECSPPEINNVIEWRRPDWAANLPLSGTEESRVLQKVVTEGVATPEEPTKVNLKLVGLNLLGKSGSSSDTTTASSETTESDESTSSKSMMDTLRSSGNAMMEAIRNDGLPVGLLETKPVEWKGPLSAPFGQFEILYLDDDMRIVRTSQGFLAINVRNLEEDWF